ncbi:putative ATPase [Trachipleistophora hominis]|uniref:Putative ATPase n=1 Tax=Trachipleistophora hominis TaxID=72359 RepID=L7JV02_TRAHO|nr:putative ATPase [Trachipleistophora hominis]
MSKCPGIHSERAGQAEACASCPNSTYCQQTTNSSTITKSRIARNTAGKKIIAVMSGKGGVGKSTMCMQIAHALKKCCVLDFDVSGPSIAKMSGTENAIITNVQDTFVPVHVHGTCIGVVSAYHVNEWHSVEQLYQPSFISSFLINVLSNCNFDTYTHVVIDTPPGITDEHLIISNYVDAVCVLVSTPGVLAVNDLVRQIDFCERAGVKVLGVVENMREFVCECGCVVPMGTVDVREVCLRRGVRYLGGLQCVKAVGMFADGGMVYEDALFAGVVRNITDELEK